MRSGWMAVLMGIWLMGVAYAGEQAELKTDQDKISYSIGMDIGKSFKMQSLDLNEEFLTRGIRDALSGEKALLTDEEVREVLAGLQQDLRAKEEARMKDLTEKNRKAGEDFLVANAKKEGVVTLPSGLQYRVITAGTGPSPKDTNSVTTHYRGTLVDGTEFDSSYGRNEPATFPVSGVIPGWTEALQLMKVGAKWKLFIPPDLAYGPRGAGALIGPNSTLVFEIELLGIK